jgi:hypothetical protein
LNLAIVVIELIDTVLYASAAGIGVAVVFSVAIYGATRCADFSREGRHFAAFGAGIVAAIALLTCLAAAVGGIFVMVD